MWFRIDGDTAWTENNISVEKKNNFCQKTEHRDEGNIQSLFYWNCID